MVPYCTISPVLAHITNYSAEYRKFSHFCVTGFILEESVEKNISARCDFSHKNSVLIS